MFSHGGKCLDLDSCGDEFGFDYEMAAHVDCWLRFDGDASEMN